MTQQPTEAPAKKRKHKDFAQIAGSCKMAKLSDGYAAKDCPKCETNHKLRCCPWCGHVRSKKK